jgi:hypothetical protein
MAMDIHGTVVRAIAAALCVTAMVGPAQAQAVTWIQPPWLTIPAGAKASNRVDQALTDAERVDIACHSLAEMGTYIRTLIVNDVPQHRIPLIIGQIWMMDQWPIKQRYTQIMIASNDPRVAAVGTPAMWGAHVFVQCRERWSKEVGFLPTQG